MTEAVLDAPALAPETPGKWLEQGYEALYALSWRDVQDVQLKALQLQFDKFSTSVAALEKLARREGVTQVDSVEDALPLLFDHRVYKSYPLSLIEKRDIAKLNAWLGRLTTHDLSKVDLTGVTMIDHWLGPDLPRDHEITWMAAPSRTFDGTIPMEAFPGTHMDEMKRTSVPIGLRVAGAIAG